MDINPHANIILFSHELPNDEVPSLFRKLHQYSKTAHHRHLSHFLEKCASILRQTVGNLPRPLRDSIPPFLDVITLVSHWNDLKMGPLQGVWEGALLCIYEIGILIGYHEARNISLPYSTERTCLAGMSVGLFAAAAVATSKSLEDLVYYGAESVRVAFSFCTHVGRFSCLLESTSQASSVSWATAVVGVAAEVIQAELDQFNGQGGSIDDTPGLSRVSISHFDSASVGVTGPPARLQRLFQESQVLSSSRHTTLPISGGLCHVPNVYNTEDVRAILDLAGVWERWGSRPVHLPLISPFTGTAFQATSACQLIEAIVTEALTTPLFFDKIGEGLIKHTLNNLSTNHSTSSACLVLHYGTTILSEKILSNFSTEKLPFSDVQHRDLLDWTVLPSDLTNRPIMDIGRPQDSKLAVVGMSCRMPGGANSPEKLWELLMEGRDTHTVVPGDRFDVMAHFDPSGEMENAIGTRYGNFIDGPGLFDASFFNMSPREAEQTDPMQRLALVTAYEALEMAGFVPGRTSSSHVSRVGTYFGQASDDYREVNASQKIGTYGITGTERAFGNGRINYFFNFEGPSFNIDTACSSGLAAIHVACAALWAGDADTVIAGGLNVITNPDIYCMLTKGHFLSKTGQCKVWDAEADGYCRGDGVGCIVIKRLEDAITDNDNILATILSSSTNHSAESISITQPHAGAQRANYRQVMNRVGLSPLDVSYVELHGTGTQVGDAIESESVLNFFSPPGKRLSPEQRLHLGAIKSNIGHGEAAAGVASLIKVLLMYKHNKIPKHVGIKSSMNPVVSRQLTGRNAGVLPENAPWLPGQAGAKRYSIINSFGAHGGNTTLLLEDAPPRSQRPKTYGERCQVVCISAKSKSSLRGNLAAVLRYLKTYPETDVGDVAYTTSARRMHHHIRTAFAVSSTTQLVGTLQAAVGDIDSYAQHVSSAKKRTAVFAFSGQGSFSYGAAARLFEQSPAFRDQVVQLDRVTVQLGFPSVIAALIDDSSHTTQGSVDGNCSDSAGSDGSGTGSAAAVVMSLNSDSSTPTEQADLMSPLVTQLASVVLQIALSRYWGLLGIKPDALIGHSLGEYAALVIADVLSVADALFLVGRRAQLMEMACQPYTHAMLSVRGVTAAGIAELCRSNEMKCRYEVSCVNGLTDIVISGGRDDMIVLRDLFQDNDVRIRCTLLDVPFAFHSSQLDAILDDYEKIVHNVTFKEPSIPVISPLLKKCVSGGRLINETYLVRATRETVDFVAALDAATEEKVIDDKTTWIDIGPHPICTSFVRRHLAVPQAQTLSSIRRQDATSAAISETLTTLHCQGFPVAWNELFAPDETSYRLLHLDPYQWNHKDFWIPYKGTWTLDKVKAGQDNTGRERPSVSNFFTSSVQKIMSEDFGPTSGHLKAISDLAHPDLKGSAGGHRINGRSVVTGSTWADLMLTVGEYMFRHMRREAGAPYMSVQDMKVTEAQVVHEDDGASSLQTSSQFIIIEADMELLSSKTRIVLYAGNADGTREPDKKPFATATVCYEDHQAWQAEWQVASHLVTARADALWKAAAGRGHPSDTGEVNRLTRHAAYQLFGNVVDYSPRYRGMQLVALAEGTHEATADIVLDADRHGTWHTPPHWIDSAFQLAGFVMNALGVKTGGEAGETESSRDFFYITPGWRHLRLTEPLQPGPNVTYRNYVRMFPVTAEQGAWAGDIFLLREGRVVGVCAGIKFKRTPRAYMAVMFPQHQNPKSLSHSGRKVASTYIEGHSEMKKTPKLTADHLHATHAVRPQPQPSAAQNLYPHNRAEGAMSGQTKAQTTLLEEPSQLIPVIDGIGQDPRLDACLKIIAAETGLGLEDLAFEAAFADLGVDSLMSLAVAGKIRSGVGIDIQASVFLQHDTVLNQSVCQMFMRPFPMPWILLADFQEARDVLVRDQQFEKSSFITNGMVSLNDSQADFKTGDTFKNGPRLAQDLMAARFLVIHMSPAVYKKWLGPVRLWERKTNLSRRRPFEAKTDFYYTSLDDMLHFAFPASWEDMPLIPQLEVLFSLISCEEKTWQEAKPAIFPSAPIHEYSCT